MSPRPRLFPAVLAALALATAVPASAQDHGRIWAVVKISDNAYAERPVMVSFIRDGQIVYQSETLTYRAPNTVSVGSQERPPGLYDVRVEGDGFVTEVKRGIQLIAGPDMTLQFVLHAGQGAHVVEYASGGLAREEVAQRLGAVEAELARLKEGTP